MRQVKDSASPYRCRVSPVFHRDGFRLCAHPPDHWPLHFKHPVDDDGDGGVQQLQLPRRNQPYHLANPQAEVLSLLQGLVHLATPAATMGIRNLPEVRAKVPMEGWADDHLQQFRVTIRQLCEEAPGIADALATTVPGDEVLHRQLSSVGTRRSGSRC